MDQYSFLLDLQLFAEEKTEKATPKKRRDAREKGQVVQSREVTSSVVLLMSFAALKWFAPSMMEQLRRMMIRFLDSSYSIDSLYTIDSLQGFYWDTLVLMLGICGPIMGLMLLSAVLINYLQVGFLFTTKPLGFKFSRLNPLEGFRRIFSMRSLVELLKAIGKIVAIGYIVYGDFTDKLQDMPFLLDIEISEDIEYIGGAVIDMAFRVGLALIVLAVMDYLYQWWDYEKNMMMSKQEIKEEFKQTEGDPQIRGKIREKQRQIGMQRMMQQVPQADAIIRNPTHYAVAIVYNEKKNKAPVVLAKGQDYVAQKIIEIGMKHNIYIVENKPLAQTLYKTTEIGEEIPYDLYQAVAEILAYVYRTRRKLRGGSR